VHLLHRGTRVFHRSAAGLGRLLRLLRILGRALGTRRKDIVLATKFGWQMDDAGRMRGASCGYIVRAVDASLKRLQTDWIDLYQLHKPDPLTPIEETLRALGDLVRDGKVRAIGCSNFSAQQLEEADKAATGAKSSSL
jgi:aryl-alcohol dehydrogenase-like predicted oxidoreductase